MLPYLEKGSWGDVIRVQEGARPQAKEHLGPRGSHRKQCRTPPRSLWREEGQHLDRGLPHSDQ